VGRIPRRAAVLWSQHPIMGMPNPRTASQTKIDDFQVAADNDAPSLAVFVSVRVSLWDCNLTGFRCESWSADGVAFNHRTAHRSYQDAGFGR
jgi:hypothetical protein